MSEEWKPKLCRAICLFLRNTLRSEGCVQDGTQPVNKRIQRVFELVLGDIILINVGDVGEKVGHISVSLWSLILLGSITHWGNVAPLLSVINLKGSAFPVI